MSAGGGVYRPPPEALQRGRRPSVSKSVLMTRQPPYAPRRALAPCARTRGLTARARILPRAAHVPRAERPVEADAMAFGRARQTDLPGRAATFRAARTKETK